MMCVKKTYPVFISLSNVYHRYYLSTFSSRQKIPTDLNFVLAFLETEQNSTRNNNLMTGLTWNKYSVILIDQWKEVISDIWWWILSEKFVMKHLMQTQVKRTWKPHRKTSTQCLITWICYQKYRHWKPVFLKKKASR